VSFIQVVDVHTSKVDEILRLERTWRKSTEGRRTLQRSVVARDRKDPKRFLVLAFFDDEESAKANSQLQETQLFAAEIDALAEGEVRFIDLEVIEDLGE
jgi:quinol monooxygenase YgiN